MRQSNIELCRITSILLVLIVHSAFAANGFPKELNSQSLWLIFLESISIIGVNVFIFISGYFSIKLKPKTIYSLIFICAFYFVLLTSISLAMGHPFKAKNILFVSECHYFIVDYIGLVLLSPILNAFVEHTEKRRLLNILMLLIVYQTYFGWFPGANATEFDYGYSLMSFSILYLIARYVKSYGVPDIIQNNVGFLYLLATVAIMALSCLCLMFDKAGALGLIYAYNNPIVIFSSICFFLYFEKKKIKENKFINHVAKSTLAVLLIHASKPAVPLYEKVKVYYTELAYDICVGNILIWLCVIVAIFVLAIIVDQLRLKLSEFIIK